MCSGWYAEMYCRLEDNKQAEVEWHVNGRIKIVTEVPLLLKCDMFEFFIQP